MLPTFQGFKKLPIQDVFGPNEVKPFGVPIFASLIANKNWFVMTTDRAPTQPPNELDLFSNYSSYEVEQLCNDPNSYFMFSLLWEGFSYQTYDFHELIAQSAIRHGVPAEKVFYVSSNLRDEENFASREFKMHVVSFNYFASQVTKYANSMFTIDQTVNNIRNGTHTFLSLNRRKRPLRNYTVYKLFESGMDVLLSCDKLTQDDFDFNGTVLDQLCSASPKTIDQTDFTTNWACEPPEAANPVDLFRNTAVSLVSETLFDTWNNTSLFHSEKTFKPMLYNHPVMIFGQQGLNTYLEQVGFKSYSNYFDLKFEDVADPKTRINLQVVLLQEIDALSLEQKIEWFLQDRETIEYNRQALLAQDYNRIKLARLLQDFLQ